MASPADNETFVRLIEICKEDDQFSQRLQKILSLAPKDRHGILNTWISEAKLRGTGEVVDVLQLLLSEEVASEALRQIR